MQNSPIQTKENIILELKNLCVNYGGIEALQNINLTINAGEVVSLIGANGAGKSTTLRAISKIVNLSSPQINYFGNSPESRTFAGTIRTDKADNFACINREINIL